MQIISLSKYAIAIAMFAYMPMALYAMDNLSGTYRCHVVDPTESDPDDQRYMVTLTLLALDTHRLAWCWKSDDADNADSGDDEIYRGTGLVSQGTLASLFKDGIGEAGVLFYTTHDAGQTLHGKWLFVNDDDKIAVNDCKRVKGGGSS